MMLLTKPSPVAFRGTIGVNLTSAFYFLPATTTSDPVGYDANVYTGFNTAYPGMKRDVVRTSGFNYVRLVTNCAPMLSALTQGNVARVDAYIADVLTAVQQLLDSGIRVIFDVHISPSDTTWGPPVILAPKSAAGAKFVTLTQLISRIATALRRFDAKDVALENKAAAFAPNPVHCTKVQRFCTD